MSKSRYWKESLRSFFLFVFSLGLSSAWAMSDTEIEARFNQALQESETGNLAEAIAIFESILSERPGMDRVRMELALANFRALNYASARSLAEQVLANPATPEPVKGTVRAFLQEVEEQSHTHLWTPYVSLGYIFDTNINVGPGTDTVDVGGATLLLGPASTPQDSGGVQANVGVGHRYLAPRTYQIGGDQAALAWQSQVSLFRNQYIGEGDFNLNVITARTGPVLLSARQWRLQLNAQADHISIGNDSIAWYAGVTPGFTWFLGGRTALTASFQAQDRDFTRSTLQDRDALYLAGGLSLGHQFDTVINPSVNLGVQVFTENADSSRRSNEGYSVNAGLNLQPFNNSNLYFNYNRRTRDYDGPEPVFVITRDEIEQRFIVGGNYRLSTDNLLDGLVLNASFTHMENNSNVPIYEYEREVTVFSVSKDF